MWKGKFTDTRREEEMNNDKKQVYTESVRRGREVYREVIQRACYTD